MFVSFPIHFLTTLFSLLGTRRPAPAAPLLSRSDWRQMAAEMLD